MDSKFYQKMQDNPAESNAYSEKKINFLKKEIGEKNTVLDVGCYDGIIGELLIKQGNLVYGLDVVKQNLEKARKKGLKVKLISTNTKKLPYQNGKFDIVLLADVIEHVFDTDELIRECRRVLKRKGKLIITTPNIASLGRRLMLLFGISPFLEFSSELPTNGAVSVGHIRYYTISTLRSQLEYNKFENVKIQGDRLNLVFLQIKFLGKIMPTLCSMIFCTAIKR